MLNGSCHCGIIKWSCTSPIESVTACNCSLCRRYGALWGYGFLNEGITFSGEASIYKWGKEHSGFYFCKNCGCLAYYLANKLDENGRLKAVVNLRMIMDPEKIAHLPVDHFEGLVTFEDLPRDERTVRHLWF